MRRFVDDKTLPTVGATGGIIQGGGHWPVGNANRLSSDNAIELKVVVPDKRHLAMNACQLSDSF